MLDHFSQNAKLHVTPGARAHHSLLTDTVHEMNMTPEIASAPKINKYLFQLQLFVIYNNLPKSNATGEAYKLSNVRIVSIC